MTRNLVDPASSHMLVSRIKPCKSQSKWIDSGSADGSLNQRQSTRGRSLSGDQLVHNNGNSIANTCPKNPSQIPLGRVIPAGLMRMQLTEIKTNASNSSGMWMKQVNRAIAHSSRGASPQELLPYQLLTVV